MFHNSVSNQRKTTQQNKKTPLYLMVFTYPIIIGTTTPKRGERAKKISFLEYLQIKSHYNLFYYFEIGIFSKHSKQIQWKNGVGKKNQIQKKKEEKYKYAI